MLKAGAARAVFLDRDGVLIEDRGPLTRAADIQLAPGAAPALRRLKQAGYLLIVVSNQTAVSRGLLTEAQVLELEAEVERLLCLAGGARIDGFYFCPHHPSATLGAYRCTCHCRKPAPGLLQKAGAHHGLDLQSCVMVGDRPSDVVAGQRAGCRTIQVQTGRHRDPPIEVEGGVPPAAPDLCCPDLRAASDHILAGAWS